MSLYFCHGVHSQALVVFSVSLRWLLSSVSQLLCSSERSSIIVQSVVLGLVRFADSACSRTRRVGPCLEFRKPRSIWVLARGPRASVTVPVPRTPRAARPRRGFEVGAFRARAKVRANLEGRLRLELEGRRTPGPGPWPGLQAGGPADIMMPVSAPRRATAAVRAGCASGIGPEHGHVRWTAPVDSVQCQLRRSLERHFPQLQGPKARGPMPVARAPDSGTGRVLKPEN